MKDLLDDPKIAEELARPHLRQEFEDIHRLKSFLGMEIHGDGMVIYTRPIEHVFAQTGEHSMLSQYKIVLQPGEGATTRENNTFRAIKMAEWGWLGPAYHPEGSIKESYIKNPPQPCFGHTYVKSIQKLFHHHH